MLWLFFANDVILANPNYVPFHKTKWRIEAIILILTDFQSGFWPKQGVLLGLLLDIFLCFLLGVVRL